MYFTPGVVANSCNCYAEDYSIETNLGYQKTLSQTKSTIQTNKQKNSKGRGVLENKPSGSP